MSFIDRIMELLTNAKDIAQNPTELLPLQDIQEQATSAIDSASGAIDTALQEASNITENLRP